jgi:hypothetical protein
MEDAGGRLYCGYDADGLRGMDLRSGADFRDLKIHADNVVF